MTDLKSILESTKEQAIAIITNEVDPLFVYHTLAHTESVVEATIEIAAQTNLGEEDSILVTIAAWLHDTGYKKGCENHEEASIAIAEKLLSEMGLTVDKIEHVKKCIAATRMPQSPQNLMQEVLCDADLFHLSSDQFINLGNKLRDEWSNTGEKTMTDDEWNEMNFQFIKRHTYFTNYGKTVLEKRKQKNIKQLKKEKKDSAIDPKYVSKLESEVVKLQNKLEQVKITKPDRGIETMFRTTSKNHLTLSAMADTKANIMISINSILLSVVVTILMRKLENNPHLIIPTFALTLVCLVTIVIAILATRPNVSSGTFTKEDILKKKTNLLFFGNFHGVDLKDYEWGMKEMLKDADYLYSSLTRDIYFLGAVLGKKYKLLRICYTIFMFGIVISVLLFVIAVLFYAPIGETSGFILEL
jgi:predicted metal-dependent HD superfamily phosphohydrolase